MDEKHPCTQCKHGGECHHFRTCKAWRCFFKRKWKRMQKLFGIVYEEFDKYDDYDDSYDFDD